MGESGQARWDCTNVAPAWKGGGEGEGEREVKSYYRASRLFVLRILLGVASGCSETAEAVLRDFLLSQWVATAARVHTCPLRSTVP